MIKRITVFLLAFFTLCISHAVGQQLAKSVFFIGNTCKFPDERNQEAFKNFIRATKEDFILVHLGDIKNARSSQDYKVSLENLTSVLKGVPNGKMYFIPGDRDWDNSKKGGFDSIVSLQKQVEAIFPGSFLPGSGCPGPVVIDAGDYLRIIAVNSQWWMHPYYKPTTHDNDCKCRSEQEFIDNLDEMIRESEGKNILILGHHPIISEGNYGGHIPLKRHLFPFPDSYVPLPVLGTIYSAYRQNAGTVRDMAHPSYQRFIKGMKRILDKSSGVIYASAHESNKQLSVYGENYQLISGSLSKKEPVGKDEDLLFRSASAGFSKLEYYTDGTVKVRFYKLSEGAVTEEVNRVLYQSGCSGDSTASIPVNHSFDPCPPQGSAGTQPSKFGSITKPASLTYKAGPLKRFFFGNLYRSAWLTPVNTPVAHLDTLKGGLRPFGKGGGRQTISLKFKAGNGYEYVFRSIDKDFTRTLLPPTLKHTFLEPMLRDITATQHPYGAFPVSKMLDKTEILHSRPELFVLPDDPRLGQFRKEFAGMPGILEERPEDKKTKNSFGADKINRSTTMITKLYEDHNNRVETNNLGLSRVFDMFIGDWGRHEDNYKWAAFKKKDGILFYPIPRDRDQAFSKWNGLIPSLADGYYALPFVENFDDKFHNLKSLNYNARHLDRLLLSSLTKQDWKRLSEEIEKKMTDAVIDSAMASLPPEVQSSGKEIADKLKRRRTNLTSNVEEYYRKLAETIDVVGSNKNEYFEAERLPNGNVVIKMWARNELGFFEGDPLYEREVVRKETKEICLYGLGGEDVFVVKGAAKKTILIRVIGGDGDDKIIDSGTTGIFERKTYVYDTKNTALTKSKGTRDKTSDKFDINHYDRHDFKYNLFIPSFGIFYRTDDGLGVTFREKYTTYGFRKPEFKTIYDFSFTASTNKNLYLTGGVDWARVLCKWDLVFRGSAGRYYPNFNFFGLGNNSKKYETPYQNNFYLLRTAGFTSGLFLERKFFKYAYFHAGPVLEQVDISNEKRSLLASSVISEGRLLGGLETMLNLDLRNKTNVATKGFRLSATVTPYHDLSASSNFTVSEAFAEYYANFNIFLPIVIAAEAGGSKISGDKIPLNKYAFLGQKNHLRGYVRHRFTGDQTAYLNTELRINLGKSENEFIPFYFGIFGFKDFGKVWYKGQTGNFHGSEGGGFFIAPITTSLTVRCSVEHSKEENLLLDIGAGFYIDR